MHIGKKYLLLAQQIQPTLCHRVSTSWVHLSLAGHLGLGDWIPPTGGPSRHHTLLCEKAMQFIRRTPIVTRMNMIRTLPQVVKAPDTSACHRGLIRSEYVFGRFIVCSARGDSDAPRASFRWKQPGQSAFSGIGGTWRQKCGTSPSTIKRKV